MSHMLDHSIEYQNHQFR